MPLSYNSIHGMVRASAIHTDPFQFHINSPFMETRTRAGMLYKVADFIGLFLIPRIAVITSIDNEYVPFFNFSFFHKHFRSIKIIVSHLIRDIDHDTLTNPFLHRNISNRSAACMEMNFTVHMCSDMITDSNNLPISSLAHMSAGYSFKILNSKRHIAWPRRSMN